MPWRWRRSVGPYHAVIAHAFSHIEEDEAGAPALFSGGAKIVTADTPLAKLTPDAVDALARKGRGVHHVKPRALSHHAGDGTRHRLHRRAKSPRSRRWRAAMA